MVVANQMKNSEIKIVIEHEPQRTMGFPYRIVQMRGLRKLELSSTRVYEVGSTLGGIEVDKVIYLGYDVVIKLASEN